jgi:hypothetical protein
MLEAEAASTLEICSLLIRFFTQEDFIAFIRHESLTFDMVFVLVVDRLLYTPDSSIYDFTRVILFTCNSVTQVYTNAMGQCP